MKNTIPGDFLRSNLKQHKAKNTLSKVDDKNTKVTMETVMLTLERRFGGVPLTNVFDSMIY